MILERPRLVLETSAAGAAGVANWTSAGVSSLPSLQWASSAASLLQEEMALLAIKLNIFEELSAYSLLPKYK
ncbi:hypothetical protein Pmani_005070 [Petrolisthes manimaculis]|uniref:Uncharacterized protein n=1 Tax=Petrolisthes manimaculis TaxID=1843537 RepID=A0AAE1UMI6_9EUCA|nr:hypothetical protein Pmani_005070 [Petrolisthes manimaculis]